MSKLAHSNQETMDAIERNAMKNDDIEHCQCPACQDGSVHDSDCAVHNKPAYPIGPCDCSLQKRTIPQEMVDRFLSWPLPIGFSPDCGISFDGRGKDAKGYEKQWPVGTNLFSAEQARNMLEHVVAPTLRYERLLLSNAEKEIANTSAPNAERQLAELQEKTQRMVEPQNPCNCVPDGDDGTVAHLCHWHKTMLGKAYRMQNMAGALTVENIAKLPMDKLRLWIAHGIQESTARKRAEEQLAELQAKHDALVRAANAVIERWHTPAWKDAPATAVFINNLRAAMSAVALDKGDE